MISEFNTNIEINEEKKNLSPLKRIQLIENEDNIDLLGDRDRERNNLIREVHINDIIEVEIEKENNYSKFLFF